MRNLEIRWREQNIPSKNASSRDLSSKTINTFDWRVIVKAPFKNITHQILEVRFNVLLKTILNH